MTPDPPISMPLPGSFCPRKGPFCGSRFPDMPRKRHLPNRPCRVQGIFEQGHAAFWGCQLRGRMGIQGRELVEVDELDEGFMSGFRSTGVRKPGPRRPDPFRGADPLGVRQRPPHRARRHGAQIRASHCRIDGQTQGTPQRRQVVLFGPRHLPAVCPQTRRRGVRTR